jgi:predicted Zn finger-like uncharacterized protein
VLTAKSYAAGMPVTESAPVVIACPHCGTRYQVSYAAIGAKGREVQCAHCGKSWHARAEPPPVQNDFDEVAEDLLDEKFAEEERHHGRGRGLAGKGDAPGADHAAPIAAADATDEHPLHGGEERTLDDIKAAIAPKPATEVAELPDPAASKRRQQEFSKRQRSVHRKLPVARLRRAARLAALTTAAAVLAGGIMLRQPLVSQFPQLAGLYAGIGLPVNVIGLEFADVHTVKSLQQGSEVLVVDGRISSVASSRVPVPAVIVTLLGDRHEPLYEWSVPPRAADLAPGQSLTFETRLARPPGGAVEARLNFADASPVPKATDVPQAAH